MTEFVEHTVPLIRGIVAATASMFVLGYMLRHRHWHTWTARSEIGRHELLECRSCGQTRLVRVQAEPEVIRAWRGWHTFRDTGE
jgi:hypothetical protein